MDSSTGDAPQIQIHRDADVGDGGGFSDVEIIDPKEDTVKDSNEIIGSPSRSVSESEAKAACDQKENPNSKSNGHIPPIKLQMNLPQPVPPPQVERSQSVSIIAETMPSIGKYIRERSNSFSAAITRRLASLKDDAEDEFVAKKETVNLEVSEFKIPGIKVIVKLKSELDEMKGRVTFFSRSNCRDSTAVRSFLRQRGLRYVEINVDVFPEREKEVVELTGKAAVPQIFFNEKYFGGLVALNSLRNSGDLDKTLKEMLGSKCPDDAPAVPQYGFDYEEEKMDELAAVVKVLRQVMPIQDRLIKMKVAKNCFTGYDMVEAIVNHLDCGRKKAAELGKRLAQKHFIHHVFGGNEFEDGKHHCYRFLEHEPFTVGCYNHWKCVNDSEPKSAAFVNDRLAKLMFSILESYASENRQHVDYYGISKSEEFRRYLILARDLQRVNLKTLKANERLAFFLNLYNAMVIHAVISIGHPEGVLDKRAFFNDFQYLVGGYGYSLSAIENGILRRNTRSPYSWIKPFGNGDGRLELQIPKANPLIHFGLCNGTRSSPGVRFFSPQGVESELRSAAREFFQRGGISIDLDKRAIHLTRIMKWFGVDFGEEKDRVKWVFTYLDAAKTGLLAHLLDDGGPINIVYQSYDWSGNGNITR